MLNLLQLPQETNTLSDKLIFSLKVVSFYCTLSETPNCNICSSLPSPFLTKLVPAGFLSLAAYAPENVDTPRITPPSPETQKTHQAASSVQAETGPWAQPLYLHDVFHCYM